MAKYVMTPKRKTALRKAQAVSARKRRGKGKGKLAKANRSTNKARRVAIVAATGGLALAATGVAGAYYARKTAGGGPKAPKINHSRSTVPAMSRHNALRSVSSARWGGVPAGRRTMLPKTRSIDPGFHGKPRKPYKGDPGFLSKPRKPFTGDPGFTRGTTRKSSRRKAAEVKLARAAYGSSSPNRLIVANSGKRGGSRPIIRSRALWENRRDFYL